MTLYGRMPKSGHARRQKRTRRLHSISVDFIAEHLPKLFIEFEHAYRRSPGRGQSCHFNSSCFGFQFLKTKCSAQAWTRGLNSAVTWPVSGSIPDRFGPFFKLHCQQASARLSRRVSPPCCFATMCSMWNRRSNRACGIKQYSQRWPARRRTSIARSFTNSVVEIAWLLVANRQADRRCRHRPAVLRARHQ